MVLLQHLQGLHLFTPVESLPQLIFGFGDVSVVGVEVFLKDDLRRNMTVWVCESDAPDLRVIVRFG